MPFEFGKKKEGSEEGLSDSRKKRWAERTRSRLVPARATGGSRESNSIVKKMLRSEPCRKQVH